MSSSHSLPARPQSFTFVRRPRTGRLRARDWLGNLPLVLGLLIVLGLLAMVLFGPLLAPENPYLAGERSRQAADGSVITPPFPPSAGQPLGSDQWGRDTLSLLLYGARNTLVAALFIATARVLLGFFLGAIAGWNEGRPIDGLIMGGIQMTCALPMLLTGVLLIMALDIHRGIVVFMAALCLVGWGEIAQYVRAEFLVVRRKPFIEGARAIGLDGLAIAVRHVLPNILPALTVIALLEMGAVLMILGELGFVGVFIGGGIATESASFRQAIIPDIPEWGAMMADSRLWARSQPWMVFFPALAFFIAVLGFNLLGEGLRRLVQRGGVNTSFVFSKKMLLVLGIVIASTAYIITHVGPAPTYARLAQDFDPDQAMTHLQALAGPGATGREVGTPGGEAAAGYIAARFQEFGLQPLNQRDGYYQPVTLRLVRPVQQPSLSLLAPDGSARTFRYRVDFGADIVHHGGSGQAEAPLVYVDFASTRISPQAFRGLDLRGRIVMYDAAAAPPDFDLEALVRGAAGLLLVTQDIEPRLQIVEGQGDFLRPPAIPTLRVSAATADALLAPAGLSLAALRASLPGSASNERPWRSSETGATVQINLQLSPAQEVIASNVLGVLPGSDANLNRELVIVSTFYDTPGQDPDGTTYAGANKDAAGVAVMLDILRLWHEQGFRPRRTVLFAAWTGGELPQGGAFTYAASTRTSLLVPVAVLHLAGVGRGGEALAADSASGDLNDLLQRSANTLGVDLSSQSLATPGFRAAWGPRVPFLALGWQEDAWVPPAADDIAGIDANKLKNAGSVANLMLITLSREAVW